MFVRVLNLFSSRERKEVYRPSVREGALGLPKLRAAAQGNDTLGLCTYCNCRRLHVCVSVKSVLVSMQKEVRRPSVREGALGLPKLRAAAQGNDIVGLGSRASRPIFPNRGPLPSFIKI